MDETDLEKWTSPKFQVSKLGIKPVPYNLNLSINTVKRGEFLAFIINLKVENASCFLC